ncbi:hypothetical protein AYI69_g2905 [Smittium culicis]|uniref:Transmembrane protein 242 n=1 Tax=Smittium culicis TaxID=133412 RepID=A0A1R1YL45_9FUNG|nr:hypothetical protein AYI69_g2905 [Smittium culicis]
MSNEQDTSDSNTFDLASISESIEEFGRKFEESKPKPLTYLGIGAGLFTTASIVAILLGRKKGYASLAPGEISSAEPMRLAMRAFGIATLGCVSVFSVSAIAASLYLSKRGIDSVPKFTIYAQNKIRAFVGSSIEDRENVDLNLDSSLAKLQKWDSAFNDDE